MKKRLSAILLFGLTMYFLIYAACFAQEEPVSNLQKLDMGSWLYNAVDDVYYQLGIPYCETPADENYENLAVFVPGSYFKGTNNGNDTWTCTVNPDAVVGDFTPFTAPIVFPVETPGYSAMAPLTAYSSLTAFTGEGFIYVHAGCRGRNHGAPAGVTDLKAAVRYIRYNADLLPGNPEAVFTFGMSGGGAQSALMGATGDSELYEPYLNAIGAVQGVSDAVYGSMCWCPITNLDLADESYEWMMGVTRSGLTDEQQAISDNLAAAFAAHLNGAGLKDPLGNVLTLEAGADGIYQGGSYYDYLVSEINRSLNHFLIDTTFPYDASASQQGGGRGMMGGGRPDGAFGGGMGPGGMGQGDGQRPDFAGAEGFPGLPENAQGGEQGGEVDYTAVDDITRNETTAKLSLTGVYETPQDYIDAMNANEEWVEYDADTNSAKVMSIASFVKAFKTASKNLGAFDQLDRGQGENTLFGYGDGNGAHFDPILGEILTALGSEYAADFAEDLARTDAVGNTVDVRLNMYNPMYYLMESEEGFGSSSVAKHWRIRTGIAQSDTSLSTEVDLSLALMNFEGVESVDFETIWAAGHTKAERSGSSDENFIRWVKSVTVK